MIRGCRLFILRHAARHRTCQSRACGLAKLTLRISAFLNVESRGDHAFLKNIVEQLLVCKSPIVTRLSMLLLQAPRSKVANDNFVTKRNRLEETHPYRPHTSVLEIFLVYSRYLSLFLPSSLCDQTFSTLRLTFTFLISSASPTSTTEYNARHQCPSSKRSRR